MTKIVFGMLATVMLIGCDLFVSPKVVCDQITVGTGEVTQVAQGAGIGRCVFGETLFTVVHAPRVDSLQSPNQTDLALVGAKVFVAASNPTLILCNGVGDPCAPPEGASNITAVVGRLGQVAYRGTIEGTVLLPTGIDNRTGTLITESYGPGNSCNVLQNIKYNCVAPPEPK